MAMRLRWHLTGLVVALLVPLLLLMALLVVFLGQRERDAVERGMAQTVRALTAAADTLAAHTVATLDTLAASGDLRPDDLADFREDAENVPAIHDGAWALLTLVDPQGEELIRIPGPEGDLAVPPAAQSDYFTSVMTRREPAITTLATVRTQAGDILLPVSVPVLRDGEVRFVLTVFYKASALARVFAEQQLQPGWIVAVVDRANRIIARSADSSAIVGQEASPQFAAAIQQADAGRFAGARRDGIDAINHFRRSPQTGWVVVLSAPLDSLLAPARRLAWTVGLAGAAFLFAGLGVTALLGRRIARSITTLGAPARALGRGEPLPDLPPTRVAEVAELAAEMQSAATLLRQRERERDEAEASLAARIRQRAEAAALGIEALQQRDLDAFLVTAATRIAAVLGVDICSVLELLPDGSGFRIRAGAGLRPDIIGLFVPAGSASHAGYTIDAGEPVIVEDYATETRFAVPAFVREHGVVSAVTVIIHGPDRPFGVVGGSSRTRRTFTADDISFLQTAANVASIAIAREAADRALRRSEERHRSVIERARQIIWIQAKGRIVFANPYAHEAFGIEPPDTLVGRTLLDLFHPEERERVLERSRRVVETGQAVPPAEMRLLRPDGGGLLVEIQGMPITYEGGPAVLGIGHDITERRRAEDALRQSEQRFREFAESASDFMWELDADLRFSFVSRTIPGLENVIGLSVEDLPVHALDPEAMRALIERFKAREPFREFIYSWIGGDMHMRHLRASGQPIFDEDGAFAGYRGTGADISEQVEADERVRQVQKMEAVGQLTGGIAHDFNNLLSVVIGNAEMLLERVDPKDRLTHALVSQLSQAGARGADLTGRLLAFSRRQPLTPRLVRLNELAASVLPLLRRTLGENVEIRAHFADDLGTTVADGGQIENAVLNLAVNARDAMPNGGQLTIETRNVELDDSYAHSVGDLKAGRYVMLAVTDTGCGMPPDVRQRAFEPFFTTKEKGKGTGLGLAMIYGFVRQSGGHVTIYSEVGHGTIVRMYLPRSDAGGEAAVEPGAPAIVPGGGETVLLVEDDQSVREMLALRLADLGYTVIEAQHGRAALDMIRGGAAFDLILTDVVMPSGVDGWDLAQAVWSETPGMPVVFMTGYTDNVVLQRAREDRKIHVLSKPFRHRDLAAMLREALDARRT